MTNTVPEDYPYNIVMRPDGKPVLSHIAMPLFDDESGFMALCGEEPLSDFEVPAGRYPACEVCMLSVRSQNEVMAKMFSDLMDVVEEMLTAREAIVGMLPEALRERYSGEGSA